VKKRYIPMSKFFIPIAAFIAMSLAASVAVADQYGGHGKDDVKIKQCKVSIDDKWIDVKGKVTTRNKRKDIKIVLEVKGEVVGDCVNPGGNTPPPHRNKAVDFEETRKKEFDGKHRKHRDIDFEFKNVKAPHISARHVCPNENWTFKVRKVHWFRVEVKVFQDHKKVASEKCL
jgi:hypothetical protein